MNLLWYWLLEPFRGGITDTPDRQPAINRRLQTPEGASVDVSLYLDPNGLPMFVKVRALDAVDDQDAAHLSAFRALNTGRTFARNSCI